MEDTLGIEPEQVIKLAKEYLAGNWLKATEDTIILKVISGGHCSSLYLCQDTTRNCEPSNFLIRLKGGKLLQADDPMKQYNEGTENIVFFMHGHLGYGPKLYGVFNGGTLEEYIPSRTSTEQDLEDKSIRMQVARKLARFHSMKLPVSRKPHPSTDTLLASYKVINTPEARGIFREYCESCAIDPSFMTLIDFPAEIDWFSQTVLKVGGRLVLSTNDMNKNNVLIRDTPDRFGEIVTLIDYEVGGTNWRGYDIAAHFALFFSQLNNHGIEPQIPYLDEARRFEFIEEYLRQIKTMEVYDDYDDRGLDSLEHLVMEADLMILQYVLFVVPMCVKPKVYNIDVETMIRFCAGARMLVEYYVEHKQHFLDKYANVLSSAPNTAGKDVETLHGNHSHYAPF